ncbi:PREDICTED: nuclear envelope integral membrane protein 1a isoform X2 [Nicrophorus vespilloides]|uniref:Nuclear envelope integral membrane protein 1a isoform X2 n=1 Tax=Nicrophorus vespilloides TaxID=110193 RepID=A0ABM1MVG0_NICVS|nr:PREDICTED: nuclear envelope integral membrane protein 1a isoform X2 [Nicrophorus vespilloides]
MLTIKFAPFVLAIFLISLQSAWSSSYFLQQGDVVQHRQEQDRFQIYCYRGKPKYIIHLWQTVMLQVDLKNDNYLTYEGPTSDAVLKEYLAHRSSWSLNLFSWKQKQVRLDPFNQSCIGIDSMEEYKVYLNIIRIDYWKVLRMAVGIFLFLSAKKLSRNTLFYYLCGISFGICASFLILIYFISKLFPRKPMMYGVAICGWTVGIYIVQMLWENIRVILLNYQTHVACYAFITGIISFIVCYWFGPVKNERTHNIIQWTLQTAALVLVFLSSQFQEAAMGQIVLLVLGHNFPKRWITKSQAIWKRQFPPKINLISEEQYHEQGVKETTKAIEDLRKFCSSPDCNQWKMFLKLKDGKRFASFMEGDSHLSDQEMIDYEYSITGEPFETTDDEDDLMTEEED